MVVPEPNLVRYRGQLNLPEIGPAGQRRLAAASVLCVGAGGLGSPVALYLAAAGVGRIGLLDSDEVDESNLHRQVLYKTRDVGAPKVEVARQALAALNPEITLVAHERRLDEANADALLADYDVIVDGSDNFPTRYLVNDTCVRLGKPDVWASVFRFEGQVAVFDARRGPCYRCLFPAIPPSEEIPSCAAAGVLGVLPGVLGTTQALEAIKLVLGVGEPLIGRMLVFDALRSAWQELAFDKDPACASCGAGAAAAPRPRYDTALPAVAALSADELQRRLRQEPGLQLIDCRESFEWEICRLPGSRLVPLAELLRLPAGLAREAPTVIVCHVGPRAMHAAAFLREAGFRDVAWLEGGLNEWARRIDPEMPRY